MMNRLKMREFGPDGCQFTENIPGIQFNSGIVHTIGHHLPFLACIITPPHAAYPIRLKKNVLTLVSG